MSIKIMSEIWDQADVEGSALLLLLALADMANDTGTCWPSIDTLALKIRLKKRQVINLLDQLEEKSMIKREHRRKDTGEPTSNLYQVWFGLDHKVGALECTHDDDKVQSSTLPKCNPVHPGSAAECTQVVQPSAPESSFKHQLTTNESKKASLQIYENMPDPARVLNELKSTLKWEFEQTDFSRKIKPLQPLGWVGETLRIGHPSEPVITFLTYRARQIFERNLRVLTGNNLVEVEFVLTDDPDANKTQRERLAA